jgi:hypothetical protein
MGLHRQRPAVTVIGPGGRALHRPAPGGDSFRPGAGRRSAHGGQHRPRHPWTGPSPTGPDHLVGTRRDPGRNSGSGGSASPAGGWRTAPPRCTPVLACLSGGAGRGYRSACGSDCLIRMSLSSSPATRVATARATGAMHAPATMPHVKTPRRAPGGRCASSVVLLASTERVSVFDGTCDSSVSAGAEGGSEGGDAGGAERAAHATPARVSCIRPAARRGHRPDTPPWPSGRACCPPLTCVPSGPPGRHPPW